MDISVLLVGTGPMAIEYSRVLISKNVKPIVIGRGIDSAQKFESITGIKPILGGLEKYLDSNVLPKNTYVIIATGTEQLMSSLLLVLNAGAFKVLIEKPAAISIEELLKNEEKLSSFFDKVYIAYNRRFYASVLEVMRMLEEDGGLQTMNFEFTEWAHIIEPLKKAEGVKANWFFANSTHVVDLAFYIAGKPKDWHAYSKSGELTWHSKTNFAGAGVTNKQVLFSYISNWESAGRWSIELLTNKRRIYLKPMEKISVQQKGSVAVVEHNFDDSVDLQFKPGLMKQVEAFLNDDEKCLLKIKEHIDFSNEVYNKIVS